MRPSQTWLGHALALLTSFSSRASAEYVLKSTSLNSCLANSKFSASYFDMAYTPDNSSASLTLNAVSTVNSYVIFDISIFAYGYEIMHVTLDPCSSGSTSSILSGFCPMNPSTLSLPMNLKVDRSATASIPGIAYTFPDIDAKLVLNINGTEKGKGAAGAGAAVACVEAEISNGKTVDLLGVKWAAAIITGLTLVASAFLSEMGHTNAASHVAANALSLCGYFQAQAMIGLCAVPLPPIVQAWTQDFQWSVGIIRLSFLQTIYSWFDRATAGTPTVLLSSLSTTSVQVEKRDLGSSIMRRGLDLMRRELEKTENGAYLVRGMERVAYRANIEGSNLFMTGLISFYILIMLTILVVTAFWYLCEFAVKRNWMRTELFSNFRTDWKNSLKGILFRITLIGYPAIAVLCLWEFSQKDSPAEVVLAVFFLFGVSGVLGWAAWKVIGIGRRSVALHQNPAYILFSDPRVLNKWGFLYIQFRASAFYFIVPIMSYALLKAFFVALAQGSGTAQAIGILIIEIASLIAASVLRPWMDKRTNSFNIAICAVNFVNAICLFVFTDVFGQPGLVTGVFGVFFWLLNAIFTLVLLVLLIGSTALIFWNGNPDGRYQFMGDDRTSFMKSQGNLAGTNELDALGMTARGANDKSAYFTTSDQSAKESPSRAHFPADHTNHALYRTQSGGSAGSHPLSAHSSRNGNGDENTLYPNERGLPPGASASNKWSPWKRGAGYDH